MLRSVICYTIQLFVQQTCKNMRQSYTNVATQREDIIQGLSMWKKMTGVREPN